mgnify:CR=1 FL=1
MQQRVNPLRGHRGKMGRGGRRLRAGRWTAHRLVLSRGCWMPRPRPATSTICPPAHECTCCIGTAQVHAPYCLSRPHPATSMNCGCELPDLVYSAYTTSSSPSPPSLPSISTVGGWVGGWVGVGGGGAWVSGGRRALLKRKAALREAPGPAAGRRAARRASGRRPALPVRPTHRRNHESCPPARAAAARPPALCPAAHWPCRLVGTAWAGRGSATRHRAHELHGGQRCVARCPAVAFTSWPGGGGGHRSKVNCSTKQATAARRSPSLSSLQASTVHKEQRP